MSDKPPFDRETPQNRTQAIAYIAALQHHFEIEDGEDFLINVIEVQDQRHAERFDALLKQVAGTVMTATGMNSLILDMPQLLDRLPHKVTTEDLPNGKVKLILIK